MKLTNFRILPLVIAGAVLLALGGCGNNRTYSPPIAVDDGGVGASGTAVEISVVANDTDLENNLDVSSIQIIGTDNPGDSLVVTGEGTWYISPLGVVTFEPDYGFTNDPSVIEYIVFDMGGLVSNIATVTIDYPQTAPEAVDDDTNGTSGMPTTINVLANDTDAENDINASSLQIVGTSVPGDSLVVAGEGNWSISSNDRIVFTPVMGYTGDPTSIRYTVTDNTGLISNEATVTVDYPQTAPVANPDDSNGTLLNTPVTINVVENDTDAQNDINVSTVNFVDTVATDTDNDEDNDHLIVEGEGNWTVDEDGNVTFTPNTDFTGDPTPVFYTISDNTGLISNEANITVDYLQATPPENNTTYSMPVSSKINIMYETTSITKVTVTVNLSGIWIGEISMRLISPLGTSVVLVTGVQHEGGTNYINTTFDDDALTPISSGSAPFTGSYSPEGTLADLNGENANGTWTLEAIDEFANDGNTLNSWNITIE